VVSPRRQRRGRTSLSSQGADEPDSRSLLVGAETMVGLKRLDNLEFCIRNVVERQVPGDLIETGDGRQTLSFGEVTHVRAI